MNNTSLLLTPNLTLCLRVARHRLNETQLSSGPYLVSKPTKSGSLLMTTTVMYPHVRGEVAGTHY
jgi:hypothetical protein